MAWEDDILATVRDLIARSRDVTAYSGVVSAVDTSTKVVSVIVDGAQAATPCLPLQHMIVTSGQRVVIMKAADTWYVVGVMGLQATVRLPGYTGSHPTGTTSGDMWYRTDLHHAYVNVNGTPTQIDN